MLGRDVADVIRSARSPDDALDRLYREEGLLRAEFVGRVKAIVAARGTRPPAERVEQISQLVTDLETREAEIRAAIEARINKPQASEVAPC